MSTPRSSRSTRWFGLVMGTLLVADGIAETVRLTRSGDGGLWFWFPTLVGGGLLVITGTILVRTAPVAGCVLTTIGAVAAMPPTFWTIIVPILLVVLIVLTAKQAAGAAS